MSTGEPSRLAARPVLWPAITLAASFAVLAVAWGFQYIGGLAPCPLCLYQRWPYWAAIVVSALGVILARQAGARGMAGLAGLCAIIFAVGAGLAAFHVGVEQSWWAGLAECGGGPADADMSLDELRRQLMATPVVRCDEVSWSLFGISMAGYNFLISVAFALASAAAARHLWRNRNADVQA